jgi:hypothetical protein
MKTEIIDNINNPKQLERLYRDNNAAFRKAFNSIYFEIREHPTAQTWNERLNFENESISWGTKYEMLVVVILGFLSGLIAKIPEFTSIDEEYFYPRHLVFIVFPGLTAYFAWKLKLQFMQFIPALLAFVAAAVYINFLPDNSNSDTLILACIHLPLVAWAVFGYTYAGGSLKNVEKRLEFLKYNGDMVVMMALILISGGILAGITVGLFGLININIEETYFQYVGIWGLAAAPVVATYLVQTNPHLVNKVSPVIAKVFSPLVLITLVVYLSAIVYSGKDPYNDRDFLLIFNVLLIGVMALILFSIAETSKKSDSKIETLILLGLSIVTIIVNGVALSAIVFRITEWGITPNRLAVLGSNVLMLTNLLIVTYRLFKTTKDRNEVAQVERSIASFLPVYAIWAILVTFLFPILFSYK